MGDVAKHDSKEKGEGHASKISRINLLVAWYSISIDNVLEALGEVVRFYVSRRLDFRMRYLL